MQAARTRTLLAAIGVTMLVCVVAIGGSEPLRGNPDGPAETREEPVSPTVVAPPPEPAAPEEDSGLPAWLLVVIAVLALAAILAAAWLLVRGLRSWDGLRRRRAEPDEPEPDEDDTPVAVRGAADSDVARRAVEAALEPLRDPTDPRSAVIAAYARMETVLAERELGRRRPEAPREYLARVLGEGGMPEHSLTTLTDMFEEARFSRHPIPDSAPRRALGELEQTRAALAARGD